MTRVTFLLAVAVGIFASPRASAQPHPKIPSAPAPAAPPAATPAPLPPPPAPPAPPSLGDTLTGQAKADYDSAHMLFGVNDFAGALIKFTSAYDASRDARLLWQMGACQGKLHHYAKALAFIRQYVKDGGALLTDQDRADADGAIRAMEPLTSSVEVKAKEDGAEVFLDDAPAGKTPLEAILVDIGVHKIRVHKDGFHDFASEVTVSGSAKVPVEATLAAIVHEARLHVHAGPKDSITIDGEPSGVGLWSGTLKSGGHTLRVTAEDMLPYQTEVLLEDDQSRTIDVKLNPKPSSGLPAWVWITGGIVVAGGLGTGAYFLLKPTSQYTGPAGTLTPGIVYANAPLHF